MSYTTRTPTRTSATTSSTTPKSAAGRQWSNTPTKTPTTPHQIKLSPSGKAPLCKHGKQAKRWVSQTTRNPERAFWQCARGRDDVDNCKFFVWEDQIPGFTSAQKSPSTTTAAGKSPSTTSTSLYNPALASLASRAAPNPHNVRTAQRNSAREGYVLSSALATATSTSNGGEERQEAKRARYKVQRVDLEVPEDQKRGFELPADVRSREWAKREKREKEVWLRELQQERKREKEAEEATMAAAQEKKPITSLPVPNRPNGDKTGDTADDDGGDDARRELNPFWDGGSGDAATGKKVKREPEALKAQAGGGGGGDTDDVDEIVESDDTVSRDDDPHGHRRRQLKEHTSVDSISSVTEAEDDEDTVSLSRSRRSLSGDDGFGGGMDWSAVAQDADAIELAARRQQSQAGRSYRDLASGSSPPQDVSISQVSRLSASPPLLDGFLTSSASVMIPDLVASGSSRAISFESDPTAAGALVTPTKRKRSVTPPPHQDKIEGTPRNGAPQSVDRMSIATSEALMPSSPRTPSTIGRTPRTTSLLSFATEEAPQDSMTSPAPAGMRSLTLGTTSSPLAASSSTLRTPSSIASSSTNDLLSPLSQHLARQERLIAASEKSKEVLRGRVRALEARIKELEALLEQSRRQAR